MNRHRLRTTTRPRESGIVLLVMMIVLVLVSATVMLDRLNSASQNRTADITQSMDALAEAKASLIGYAVSYPENFQPFGPGFLPCPDIDGNGSPNPPCGPNAIGRFPWRYMGLPDVRDGAGERLWYALSDNFRNNPKVPILNSETPGQLSVDGSGDIVAVVFAPGAPVPGQNRNAGPNTVTNYLEGDNATAGDSSFSRVATGTAPFNDALVVITRGELMGQVEKRVLGEVVNSLRQYRTSYNSYPWLSPYAKPLATPLVTGTAAVGSNSTTLVDTSRNFTTDGVQVGDMVLNFADGSRARVQDPVTATTLTLAGLNYGGTNSFSAGDAYRIARFNGVSGTREGHIPYHEANEAYATGFRVSWNLPDLPGVNDFSAIATAPSPNGINAYRDKLKEFVQKNTPAAASGVAVQDGSCVWADAVALSIDAINVVNCGGSGSVDFFSGVMNADDVDELKDQNPAVNFLDLGISRGDLIEDTTDDSSGVIKEVRSDKLIVSDLHGGGSNILQSGDGYRVQVASRALQGTIDSIQAGNRYVYSGPDLQADGVLQDDYIVNLSQGKVGKILAVGKIMPGNQNFFTVQPNPDGNFSMNDAFEVRRSFVKQRRYDFRLDYTGSGTAVTDASGSGKARDVVLTNGAVGINTTISITDLDEFGNTLGTATLTVPATGINGSITATSIHYDFDTRRIASDELPAWFFNNNWHHLIYVAEANGYQPSGGGTCTAGTDCLNLAGTIPGNDIQALVVSAGPEFSDPPLSQDRAGAGALSDYFELDNASSGDDQFTRVDTAGVAPPFSATLNDQIRIVAP